MFAAFFYLLRSRGLDVSLNEWLTLLEGMEKGLHHSTLTGFYHLCRAVIVKSEVEFDRFDQAFLEFFADIPFKGEIPETLMEWLNKPNSELARSLEELKMEAIGLQRKTQDEVLQMLQERLEEQNSEHNGGKYWLGTQGNSVFGNNGWRENGLLVGGESQHQTAIMVAEERRYRDFRKDNTLDPRQFQMAFRLLRQLSVQNDCTEKELDVDTTIRDTCENAGTLQVRYKNPRKNTVKVLLLMDSGGSMEHYAKLCSMLFQAATKANHFKELHTYYFHNCIFSSLYENPQMHREDAVPTEWVLQNYDSSYKVIIVGDALMSPYELKDRSFNWGKGTYGLSGMDWLDQFRKQYPYLIWLNPKPLPEQPTYWTQTHYQLSKIFEMFHLSPEGLEQGMKRLMIRR